jgi:uncharacterized tellurite resistance protein B-like protein
MLDAIRDFFDRRVAAAPADDARALQLATAALLVEVARIDALSDAERGAVERAVCEKFGLAADDAAELTRLAEAEMAQANDYFQFTSLVNRHFSQAQKLSIVEMMWRVAYADAELSAHENHVLRKVAELLHVPHGDYIAAKMRARPDGA